LAQLRREVPDRVPELVRHLLVDDGFIEGRKILALQVLDECDLERGRIVKPLHDRGDGLFPGELRGAPPALARDDLVFVAGGADKDRLKDAVLADRCRELGKGVFVPRHARLSGIRDHLLERDVADGGWRSRGEQADDAWLRVGLLLKNPIAGISERFPWTIT